MAPTAPAAPVERWVRIGLVALAVPQLFTGGWAAIDPGGWYRNYPGVGAHLVAGTPPYNAHLATDAGAGFLATGAALLLAAWWGERRPAQLALLASLVFAAVHLAFHATHREPGLSDAAHRYSVGLLVVSALLPAVVWWGTRPRTDP